MPHASIILSNRCSNAISISHICFNIMTSTSMMKVNAYNTTYKYHLAEFGFSDVWYKNLRFGLGLRFEYYKYKDFLFKKPELIGLDARIRTFPELFRSGTTIVHSTRDISLPKELNSKLPIHSTPIIWLSIMITPRSPH